MPKNAYKKNKESHTSPHTHSIISHLYEKVNTSTFRPLFVIIFLIFWGSFSIFVSQFIFSIIFSFFFHDFSASATITTIYNALIYIFTLFLIIFVPQKLFKKLKPSRQILGLNNLPTFIDIGLAPIGFIIYYILATILINIFQNFSWFNSEEVQNVGYNFLGSNIDYLVAFFALVIIAPIAEEIIFRGWLYGYLREKLPKKYSLALSILLVSALFGFLHGQANVGINVFAMSIILCLLREITGTVYSGILLHIIKNAIAFVLVFVFSYT